MEPNAKVAAPSKVLFSRRKFTVLQISTSSRRLDVTSSIVSSSLGILAKPLIGDGGLEGLRAGYDRMIRLRFMRLLAVVLVITVILWLTPSAHSLPPFTITPTPNTGIAGTPVTITGSQEIPSGATTPLICQVSSSPGGLISSPTCTATITVPAQGLYSVSGSFTVAGGAAAGTYTVTVTVTSTPVPSFSQSASASFTVPS